MEGVMGFRYRRAEIPWYAFKEVGQCPIGDLQDSSYFHTVSCFSALPDRSYNHDLGFEIAFWRRGAARML